MWRLVLIIPLLMNSLILDEVHTTVIILNDCKIWEKTLMGMDSNYFVYSKEIKDRREVRLSYGWIDKSDSLSTINQGYPEILKSDFIFSSELSYNDWYKLMGDPARSFFILRPEDFCSDRRFWHNYQFTLYPVRIFVDGNEMACYLPSTRWIPCE